ncbi:MAG: tRNA(Ile)-lysidine synthetase [Sphingomonas bacterium]|nr:tRNA lysidine(34) synthetase TilS [Sphingomonas bacterium]MDB5688208.1 tRNA(Ile)-lysidine synthetase [Sphingomonas bacterium]
MPPPDDQRLTRFRADLATLGAAPTPATPLGLAVSGGPDSLALLILAAAALPGAIAAATVDHGLRAGAPAEARAVADLCALLGVPHRILAGNAGGGRGSVQDRARALRYRLLGTWAAEASLGWLATAHHRDDQAETFLMRAARGSGVAGLAGVRGEVRLIGVPVPVIRPLLGWGRADLGAIVAEAGITPADDPSNRDPAHDRTAFRALLGRTPLLDAGRLAAAAAHLGEAEAAIAWAVARLRAERLTVVGDTLCLHDPAALPREFRRRLVATAIGEVAGVSPLRGDALDRLLRLLDAGRAGTLAGVVARPGRDWIFRPAPPRRGLR